MYTKHLSCLKLECHLTYFAAATRAVKICTESSTESNKLTFLSFIKYCEVDVNCSDKLFFSTE